MTNFSLSGPPKLGKPGQPDHEVIVQSAGSPPSVERRLQAAESRLALADRLAEAGRAVVARWETPLWKDVEPTAVFINALRSALTAYEEDTSSNDLTTGEDDA